MTDPDFHTRTEIEGQPALWKETLHELAESTDLREFLVSATAQENLQIILTGSGSSAFIGDTVVTSFSRKKGVTARSIPATTLVTHSERYLDASAPLLLISFARSGNSPESTAVIELAEGICKNIRHIAITCNGKGRLAEKVKGVPNGLVVLLPPASEDQGLAMTGSFTSMILAALYLAGLPEDVHPGFRKIVSEIAKSAKRFIQTSAPGFKKLAARSFSRIVFLGSGPLEGIARESHLKVQELTDGSVVGKYDSFLGFRHGPKAVVNDKTIIVFLFSPEEDVFRYERDLALELLQENRAMDFLGIFCNSDQSEQADMHHRMILGLDSQSSESDLHLIPYVLPAQMLGFYKSLELGLNPDKPSRNETISRVVKAFRIYK